MGQVIVLRATGPLSDAVAALEFSVRQALAEEPRGVVCDLADVQDCAATGSLRALASVGAHPKVWPAVPVAIALADPQLRDMLRSKPLGEHLVVAGSRRLALERVMGTRAAATCSLRLAPDPKAPRAAREFVACALDQRGLGAHLPAASVVVSELVTNAVLHAGTQIGLSVAVCDNRCRISVSDLAPDLPLRSASPVSSMQGRGLAIVSGLSIANGVLPTAAGGKVVWAVLGDALAPSGSARQPPRVSV